MSLRYLVLLLFICFLSVNSQSYGYPLNSGRYPYKQVYYPQYQSYDPYQQFQPANVQANPLQSSPKSSLITDGKMKSHRYLQPDASSTAGETDSERYYQPSGNIQPSSNPNTRNNYPYSTTKDSLVLNPSYPQLINSNNYANSPTTFNTNPFNGNQASNYPFPYAFHSQQVKEQKGPESLNYAENIDPFANITTEIIDIEPRYFQYFKRYFDLEGIASTSDFVEDASRSKAGRKSNDRRGKFRVITESKHSNSSTVYPQSLSRSMVEHKSYSFKKTFVIDPSNRKDSIINLEFVNGVQVTAPPITTDKFEELMQVTTENVENVATTTESEEPSVVNSWFSKNMFGKS